MGYIEDLAVTQSIFIRYILAICAVLGMIGCIFNLIIFCRKKLRSTSCSVYFIAASIFNLLVIIFGITPILIFSYLSNDPANYSSIYCKAKAYITHVLLMLSRSCVALACIDRFALCSRNARIRRLSQRRVAIISVIFTSILCFIMPIHTIIYINIQMPERRCGGSGLYLIIYSTYAAIAASIPLIIMILFSYLAIQSIRYMNARIRPVTIVNGDQIHRGIYKHNIQLMNILIGEVIIYFLSTVLFPIYSIYLAITLDIPKTINRLAIENFIRYMTLNFLIYLNPCSLFYVHILASKLFRQEFKQIILYLFKYNQNNEPLHRVSVVSNTRNQINRA